MDTSSKHKELGQGGRQNRSNHVNSLKDQLTKDGVDLFDSCPPKYLQSGAEFNKDVVGDMIDAPAIENALFNTFACERLASNKVGFFDPINTVKRSNGAEKKKAIRKALSLLKEDLFGPIIEKSVSLQEAFQYPITTVQLAIT